IDALGEELTRIGNSTNFNGISLLNGAGAGDGTGNMTFQVGAGSTANDQISVDLTGADVLAVGTAVSGLTVDSAANSLLAIDAVDTQIANVSSARSDLGAVQNRFETAINSLNVTRENLQAAESRIRDVDM